MYEYNCNCYPIRNEAETAKRPSGCARIDKIQNDVKDENGKKITETGFDTANSHAKHQKSDIGSNSEGFNAFRACK